MKKKFPVLRTDEEAEAFLDQDLSDYLHAGNFRRVRFDQAKVDQLAAVGESAERRKGACKAAGNSLPALHSPDARAGRDGA
jgi:hypothetical protein